MDVVIQGEFALDVDDASRAQAGNEGHESMFHPPVLESQGHGVSGVGRLETVDEKLKVLKFSFCGAAYHRQVFGLRGGVVLDEGGFKSEHSRA